MRAPTLALLAAASLALGCTAGDRTPTGVEGSDPRYATTVASVVISPRSVSSTPRDTIHFTATALDGYGRVLPLAATWAVSDSNVVRVDASGLARMIAPGRAIVQATVGRTHGFAYVSVATTPLTVVSIRPSPVSASMVQGATLQLSAAALDASGAIIAGAPLAWSTSLATVASVTSTGSVAAVGTGSANIRIQSGTAFVNVPVTVTAPPAPVPPPTPATVTSVAISPSTATITVGQSMSLSAVARDAAGNVVTGRSVSWSTSAPLIASVSTSGLVAGVAPGTATLTAVVDGVRGSAVLTVGSVVPVPGSGGFPNEPAGFTKYTERDFSAKNQDGWFAIEQNYAEGMTVQSDPTAPKSGPLVMQQTYRAGFVGGSSPGTAERLFTIPVTQIYASIWVKLSANWIGHTSATNKMFYVWIAGKPKFFISAEGVGSGPLEPQVRLQDDAAQRGRLRPNVNTTLLVQRGVWQRWEFVLRSNTPGQANGEVHWWIDGVKVSDYRNVQYADPGQSPNWEQFQWSPIWGGAGGTLAAEQSVRWDHIYLSVR